MATCKDCVHFDVCCSYLSTAYNKCKLATPDFKLLKNIECDECQHFKDRSQFIELPCKVGDTVYRICPVRKGEGCNCCPWEYCECHDIGFQNDKQNSIREGRANNFAWILKRLPYFGKIYFITREEAEQALKEREKDE